MKVRICRARAAGTRLLGIGMLPTMVLLLVCSCALDSGKKVASTSGAPAPSDTSATSAAPSPDSDPAAAPVQAGDDGAVQAAPAAGTQTEPVAQNPASPRAPSGTSVVFRSDSVQESSNMVPATYAMIGFDGRHIVIAAWDMCAYYEAGMHDYNGVSAAADALGSGASINIAAIKPTKGLQYQPSSASSDTNLMGYYRSKPSGADCDCAAANGIAGVSSPDSKTPNAMISFDDVVMDASGNDYQEISGSINAHVKPSREMSHPTLVGKFVAKRCQTPTRAPTTTYNTEAGACHDSADQSVRKTVNGVHYY